MQIQTMGDLNTQNTMLFSLSALMQAHAVSELMFLTYDQLPPSIIVGTRGELNSQLWNVAGKPRKTNLKIDVFSGMICSCQGVNYATRDNMQTILVSVMRKMIITWRLSLEPAHFGRHQPNHLSLFLFLLKKNKDTANNNSKR